MTFQTRFTSWGSTVGTRLMARDTVAVDTLARLAISRISIGFQWALPCGSASILRTIYAASQSFSPHGGHGGFACCLGHTDQFRQHMGKRTRSEERRVGKEWRSRRARDEEEKKTTRRVRLT